MLAVDAPVRVDGLELVGQLARRLARAEEQHAAGLEREVKQRQHLLLHQRLEVDQQVAAGDEVDARERRVVDHVVLREHDHLPQLLDDPVARRRRLTK